MGVGHNQALQSLAMDRQSNLRRELAQAFTYKESVLFVLGGVDHAKTGGDGVDEFHVVAARL